MNWNNKQVVVLGGGGFIGGHLAMVLKSLGAFVTVADIKKHEWLVTEGTKFFQPIGMEDRMKCAYSIRDYCSEYFLCDLRDEEIVSKIINSDVDYVFQLAADMGGAGFVFTGDQDADIMHNSALVNLNVAKRCSELGIPVLYTSSACVYNEAKQESLEDLDCSEDSAWPLQCDSRYGIEKYFSEELYQSFHGNYGLDCRIVRLHNIFGPYGSWRDGREKAPAAMLRKVAVAITAGEDFIEMWGDGTQIRSFLYVDECIEGLLKIVECEDLRATPVNLGSEEAVTLNQLANEAAIALNFFRQHEKLIVKYIPGPLGVKVRNSDNTFLREKLGWEPTKSLADGMTQTGQWILDQVADSIEFRENRTHDLNNTNIQKIGEK